MNKRIILAILGILFIVVLAAVSTYLFIHFDVYLLFKDREKLVEFIKAQPYDELIFILIQIAQVVAAPIPGELTGLIGGYLYGPFFGTLYSTIGLTIGSWLAFMVARLFGMPLLEKVVKPHIVEKYDHFMEHQGILVSLLFFLIPGFPKDYMCYIMGVSRMPVWIFLIVCTCGRLVGTAMLSITGSSARNEQYLLLACVVGVGIAIFVGAYYYQDKLHKIIRKKKDRPENNC
jgi:uncharacterized membrane protein YdjX (TVP38/TMEM64 family)